MDDVKRAYQIIKRETNEKNLAERENAPHKKHPGIGMFFCGGEGGIRTLGTCEGTPDFESGTFDHSVTSPLLLLRNPIAHRRFGQATSRRKIHEKPEDQGKIIFKKRNVDKTVNGISDRNSGGEQKSLAG